MGLTNQVYGIKSSLMPLLIVDEHTLLLPHLRHLEGGFLPHTLPELCSSLSTATNLTYLKFRLDMKRFEFDGLLPNQTGLTKLERLTILLHARRPNFDETIILSIVDNLASKSRLKTLGFATRNARPPVLPTRKLVGHIVRTHRESLEKLRLPLFTLCKTVMIQLLSGLPGLTHLWIAVTKNARAWIPNVLDASQSLQKLRLYGPGNWPIYYAKSLLSQTARKPLVVKACRPCFRDTTEKVTWKSYWEYHEELKCTVRRVSGPVEAEITTISDPEGIKEGFVH